MRVLFVCKASEKIGLGHLIRSRSLARSFIEFNNISIDFFIIGQGFERLMFDESFNYKFYDSEADIVLNNTYNIIFIDMLHISDSLFFQLKSKGRLALLSPVFNKLNEVEYFFHRSKYHSSAEVKQIPNLFMGLDYSIISDECSKIADHHYKENLESASLSIAISMGGGDAKNKTLNFLRIIKNCKASVTFWIILGEGYSHSYDDLVKEVTKDTSHEIILVRSNRNMWRILQNCVMGIFPGGITVYEAAYAGLPSLILVEDEAQRFLIRELEENKLCSTVSLLDREFELKIMEMIERYYHNKELLLDMRKNSHLIDGKGKERIFEIIKNLSVSYI